MIHHTTDRKIREEDQLSATVIRELRKIDICAATMHSAVGHECYVLTNNSDGKPCYVPKRESRGKLSGYLRMVALNKILLTNQRWPFVLETPLNADLTIGVDVKHNTAGLVVVGKRGVSSNESCLPEASFALGISLKSSRAIGLGSYNALEQVCGNNTSSPSKMIALIGVRFPWRVTTRRPIYHR